MAKNRSRCCRLLAWGLAVAVPALGLSDDQPAADAAEAAALADARQKLAHAVLALPVDGGQRLCDLANATPELRAALEEVLCQARESADTHHANGLCEVRLSVAIARLDEQLARSWKPRAGAASAPRVALPPDRAVAEIAVIGCGTPRTGTAPAEVECAAAAPASQPASAPPDIPAIWQDLGAPARLLALRVAREDARRRLAERLLGLELPDGSTLRRCTPEREVIRAELEALLVGEYEPAQFLHERVPLASVKISVPAEQVADAVVKVHHRHAADAVAAAPMHVDAMRSRLGSHDALTAVGSGAPPAAYLQRWTAQAGQRLPDWALAPLEAEGEGALDGEERAQRVQAAMVAETKARRALAERLGELPLPGGGQAGDFVLDRPHLVVLVEALILEAPVTRTRSGPTAVTVTVGIPGLRLWHIISDELARQDAL